MHARQFAQALALQQQNGWARFVTMQDHYNLIYREEENEMLPLCSRRRGGDAVESAGARSPDPSVGRNHRPSGIR
jgi:aryl-alcohol dehydrogenase-like predicted oxidoreductase